MATAFMVTNFNNATPALTNVATGLKTFLDVQATSGQLRRGALYEWIVGASDVPNGSDCPIVGDISRMTAEGTAVTMTINPSVPLDTGTISPALSTSKGNHTVEPTITAQSQLDYFSFNQRSTMRWVAIQGGELWFPGVAASGLALRLRSPNYASTATVSFKFTE